MTVNLKKLLAVAEATVLAAVASFLAAVSQIPGGSFDAKHLGAAGVGAATALAYKLSGVINNALAAPVVAVAPVEPAAPVTLTSGSPVG